MTTPTLLALADRIEVVCNNASPVNHGSGSIFWMTARDWSHELRALAAPQVEMVSELPELPEPQKECWIGHDLYSADQMREYAQAALNARAGGDGLVAAIKSAREWHLGDKWRNSAIADQRDAWERQLAMYDAALASQAVGVKDGR